jgi:hypothetical protein
MTKEISYREISFQTLFMSNYSKIHYKVNLILPIKIDTKFVMCYFGDILQYFVTILRKLDEISYPPYVQSWSGLFSAPVLTVMNGQTGLYREKGYKGSQISKCILNSTDHPWGVCVTHWIISSASSFRIPSPKPPPPLTLSHSLIPHKHVGRTVEEPERRYTRVAFAPCLAVVYTFLPIKVLLLVFRGVISSLPPLLHRKVHNALPL